MQKEYVRKVEGAYRVGGTRVSLDSLVYLFREDVGGEHGRELSGLDARTSARCSCVLPGEPERDRLLSDGRAARRGVATSAIETNERRIDCEAAAGAACESDSRLTPIWTGASCAGCDGQRPRSTFALLAMPALRVWEIQKSCGSPRTPGEFLSARIGGRCLRISLDSRLALRVPESFCCAKQLPSRPRSKSLFSSGMPAKLKNGSTESCGYRFKNPTPTVWIMTEHASLVAAAALLPIRLLAHPAAWGLKRAFRFPRVHRPTPKQFSALANAARTPAGYAFFVLRRRRAVARGDRPIRRSELLGNRAAAGDRHPHGTRCSPLPGCAPGHHQPVRYGLARPVDRASRRSGLRAFCGEPSFRGEGNGPRHGGSAAF